MGEAQEAETERFGGWLAAPLVRDRLIYLVTSVAHHNLFRGQAGQGGAQAANIFGEEIRSAAGSRTARRLIQKSRQPDEILFLSLMVEPCRKNRRFQGRLLIRIG